MYLGEYLAAARLADLERAIRDTHYREEALAYATADRRRARGEGAAAATPRPWLRRLLRT